MRKFMEDMSISANEKDAEIIKLKMHLGDEKNRNMQSARESVKSFKRTQDLNASIGSQIV
jgi:hypothetical protein